MRLFYKFCRECPSDHGVKSWTLESTCQATGYINTVLKVTTVCVLLQNQWLWGTAHK